MGRGRSGGYGGGSFRRFRRRRRSGFGDEEEEDDDDDVDIEEILQGRSATEAFEEYLKERLSPDDWCSIYSSGYERTAVSYGKDASVPAFYKKELLAAKCPERYLKVLKDDYVFPKQHDFIKIPEGRTAGELFDERLEKTLSKDDWCRLYHGAYKSITRRHGKDSAGSFKEKLIASCPEKYLKILRDSDGYRNSK